MSRVEDRADLELDHYGGAAEPTGPPYGDCWCQCEAHHGTECEYDIRTESCLHCEDRHGSA